MSDAPDIHDRIHAAEELVAELERQTHAMRAVLEELEGVAKSTAEQVVLDDLEVQAARALQHQRRILLKLKTIRDTIGMRGAR